MNPWMGITLVLVALGLLLPMVKGLQATGWCAAEGARKGVHLGMGTICLSFPWIFRETWPVWVLAAAAMGVLSSIRFVPTLRRSVGSVLHQVPRTSLGDLFFPAGVALVFALADGDPILFLIPVALLTFADAAGAMVGTRWGRHRFATLEGMKSVEGSLAVGVAGMIVTVVPLLIDGLAWPTAFLMAAALGLFALNLEAISSHGLDNIFLPLAAFAQLSVHFDTPLHALAANLSVLFILTVFALWWRRGQIIDESARLGCALALYFFWTVGGPEWLVAPVLFLASYIWLMPHLPQGIPRHNLFAVLCVSSASLVWAVAEVYAPSFHWFALFTIGIATHQAIIAAIRFSQRFPRWPRLGWLVAGVAQSALVHGSAYAVLEWNRLDTSRVISLGILCMAVSTLVFLLVEPTPQQPDELGKRWWRQGATAAIASGCGLLLFQL